MRHTLWMVIFQFGFCGLGACPLRAAEPEALLDITIGQERLEGRIAAHDDQNCWVLRRDGRLASFRMDDVTDFREIEPRFRPFSSLHLRDRMRDELGRDYEIKTTSHYVVAARRGSADRYAALFEGIYRQFHTYFTTRGFRIVDPEFPLVAVVLPDQSSFVDYCVRDGARPQPGLVGYYLPGSNRVALYDRAASSPSSTEAIDNTIIHEATHQVAFNTGVHSRIGQTPLWLVEGLATLFEADGIRKRDVAAQVWDRVNLERLEWFREYRLRRPPNSLEAFLREDALFKKSTLDAYSQAWALTFYLAEKRQADFAKYLKKVSSRDPLRPYEGTARLADFKDVFGRDLDFLESDMLRFYDRLGQ